MAYRRTFKVAHAYRRTFKVAHACRFPEATGVPFHTHPDKTGRHYFMRWFRGRIEVFKVDPDHTHHMLPRAQFGEHIKSEFFTVKDDDMVEIYELDRQSEHRYIHRMAEVEDSLRKVINEEVSRLRG